MCPCELTSFQLCSRKLTSFHPCSRKLTRFQLWLGEPHTFSPVHASFYVSIRVRASTDVHASLHVPSRVNPRYSVPATFLHVGASQSPSTQVSLFSSSPLQTPRLVETFSRVSLFPVGPPMFSTLANTVDITGTRAVHSHDSVVPPHLLLKPWRI